MPLCQWPAGQSMEKSYLPPPLSHRELRLVSPLADLGKYSTDIIFKKDTMAYCDLILKNIQICENSVLNRIF